MSHNTIRIGQYESRKMSKEHIESIKAFDLFKKDDFPWSVCRTEYLKAWGEFGEKIPMVTVLIQTCNRPEMLRLALESAINQLDFDDYEIIVSDNEGIEFSIVTDTQKVIEEINSDKVIYFRNADMVTDHMDLMISHARTKYFCVLHDDDALSPYHLKYMAAVLKKYPHIPWISCEHTMIENSVFEKKYMELFHGKGHGASYKIRKIDTRETITLNSNSWHGALIDKRKYEEMGGCAHITMSMGDVITPAKFNYHFERYMLYVPLYLYRVGNVRLSSDVNTQYNNAVAQYCWYTYAFKKVLGKWNMFTKAVSRKGLTDLLALTPDVDIRDVCKSIPISYRSITATLPRLFNGLCQKLWYAYLYLIRICQKRHTLYIKNGEVTIR